VIDSPAAMVASLNASETFPILRFFRTTAPSCAVAVPAAVVELSRMT